MFLILKIEHFGGSALNVNFTRFPISVNFRDIDIYHWLCYAISNILSRKYYKIGSLTKKKVKTYFVFCQGCQTFKHLSVTKYTYEKSLILVFKNTLVGFLGFWNLQGLLFLQITSNKSAVRSFKKIDFEENARKTSEFSQ